MNDRVQKDFNWKELLRLLDLDPNWYKYPETNLYKQITMLGRKIFLQEKKIQTDRIDEQKYLSLISYGYTLNEIAAKFEVSKYTLFTWRKDKGYVNRRKLEEVR